MSNGKLYILWIDNGGGEYSEYDGTLEDAIRSVKADRRYADYGRRGALIIRGQPLYEIKLGPIERTFE